MTMSRSRHQRAHPLGGRASGLPAVAWAFSLDLPRGEKSVLVALAVHASNTGDNCYPSVDLLTVMTSLSRRQVQRNIQSLTERGAVRRELNGGPNRTNRYYLDLGWGQNRDTSDTLMGATTDQKGEMDGSETVTPMSSKVQRRNKEDSYTAERAPSRVGTVADPHPPVQPSDPIRRWEILLTSTLLTVERREHLKAKLAQLKAAKPSEGTGPSDA